MSTLATRPSTTTAPSRTPKTVFHTLLVFRCPTELSEALADLAAQRRTNFRARRVPTQTSRVTQSAARYTHGRAGALSADVHREAANARGNATEARLADVQPNAWQ